MTAIPDFLKKPEDLDVSVWRYMDLAKFLSILERKELFFPTGRTLQESHDRFEGSLPFGNAELRKTKALAFPEEDWERISWNNRKSGHFILISCWHMNKYESAAMWTGYSDKGIAIKTKFSNLTQAFHTIPETHLFVGLIKYIDYTDAAAIIPEEYMFIPFGFKHSSYQHEQEIRVITTIPEEYIDFEAMQTPSGVYIPVDLTHLIETVYISPLAPDWFAELVEAIVKRYGIIFTLKHSDLKNDPIY